MNVTVYEGIFKEGFIYLGQSYEIYKKGDIIALTDNKNYTNYIAGQYYPYSEYFKEFTFIFKLPKPSQRYLYVSIPSFSGSYVN